ncbi:hypothetical protein [Paenibacillus hamazuiensis]|uniref:hypothetical protein n=1 Tax=Paenibacillus hamazuiensis TaxID=2936508 RepID=UPI00200E2E54|nr:hypothetical protein [Paenibacillus hamazuiensis]
MTWTKCYEYIRSMNWDLRREEQGNYLTRGKAAQFVTGTIGLNLSERHAMRYVHEDWKVMTGKNATGGV